MSSPSIDSKTGHVEAVVEKVSSNEQHIDYSEADIALHLAENTAGLQFTPEQDRAVLRKIDIYVTTLICFLYAIQYMDKTTISLAAIMGLRTDLDLVGNQYSFLGTGFYLGYLVFEYPSVRLLQRFPIIKTLSAFVFIWGVVLTLNAAAFNFGSILAARVFLGVFESAVSPALLLITAQYFKKEEQFVRVSFWFSSNGLGAILNSAIAYGIKIHLSDSSFAPWRSLFLITGLITIVLSFVIFFHLPDTPDKAWFLNEQERAIAVERIRANQQAYGLKKYKIHQIKEAFKDIRTYIYLLHGVVSTIPNGGLGSFGTILINDSFGYSSTESLLINLPCGAVQISSALVCYFGARFFKHRTLVGIFCISISLIAAFLLAFGKSKHTQLAGYYLMNYGGINWVTIISMITSNTLGYTKKNTVSWLYFVAYSIGNTVGPQTFRAKDAPDYVPAKITVAALFVVSLACVVALYLINLFENKRRDKEAERLGDDYFNPPKNYEFMDYTDFENKNFRYVL